MPHKDPLVRKAYLKEYQRKNRDEIKKQRHAFYTDNAERLKSDVKSWIKKHPDKAKVYAAKSRSTHKDKAKRDSALHYQRNKEEIKARHLLWERDNLVARKALSQKRRTMKTNAGGFFTAAEWFTLCFAVGFKCLRCGEIKPLTADHVIPVISGGTGWLHNIQPLCQECNSSKGTKITDYRYQEHNKALGIGA